MNSKREKPALLLLEDGAIFYGYSAGKQGIYTGEICFNTGMTGYQEIFTDPSYFGQIMIATNPHIGNYGIRDVESQSGSVKIAGLVCKNLSNNFSRQMAQEDINNYLIRQNIPVVYNIDTRALVRHIRYRGAMNAVICSDPNGDLVKVKSILSKTMPMSGMELASKVSTTETYFHGNADSQIKVAVLDLGVKRSILDNISERGVYLQIFPAKTPFYKMEKWNPDGYFISNGPGDPSAMPYAVETVKNILEARRPMFGICLGHQMLALANGICTYKMHNGHRGLNHPVKNIITGHCEITSQNHGFAVQMDKDSKNHPTLEVTHVNLNDGTIEGLKMKNRPVFSVQYHPESNPGPHDSRYLFDDFILSLKS